MDKVKEFLIGHGEKLFLGILGVFCIYSLVVSVFGLLSSGNDYAQIQKYKTDITTATSRDVKEKVDDYHEFLGNFQTKYLDFSDLDKFKVSIQNKVFTEETKNNPLEHVRDIIDGHSNVNLAPGVNCEKFFCKSKGENVCLVCGAKGEREYEFYPPLLTNIELLPDDLISKYQENPFVDRNKVQIVWEDNIKSDRTTYKERYCGVYRIEISDALEKAVGSHIGKATYHQAIFNYIKENNIQRLENISKEGYLKPKLLVKAVVAPSPTSNTNNEAKPPKFDMFGTEQKNDDENNASAIKDKPLHKLIHEEAFYILEDTTFKPLKKYWYILIEEAKGESALKRPISTFRFGDPVAVTTGAENVLFISNIKQKRIGQELIEVNGKPVYTADIQVFQYLKLQNVFYKFIFSRLEVGDPVGTMQRDFKGQVKTDILTSIKKNAKQFLVGTDLTDDEWKIWREAYPKSFETLLRTRAVKIDLNYDTGNVIEAIGEEKVKIKVEIGRSNIGIDEKGNPIIKIEYRDDEVIKFYVDLKNRLTGEVTRSYEMTNKDIAEQLKAEKIKTIDDLK